MARKQVKKKKRVKPDILLIESWQKADTFIRTISRMMSKITKEEKLAGDKINQLKAELAKATTPWNATIKQYTRSLEAFCEQHRGEFKVKRSRKLNFGTLGWRRSLVITVTKNTISLIKKVFGKEKAATLLRTKESIDKEALRKLTDKELVSVQAVHKIKDEFFVEPDLPTAAKY